MVEIEVPTIKTEPPRLPPQRSPSPVVQESPELQPQQDLQPKPQQQPQPEAATAPADNFIPSSEADNSFSSIQGLFSILTHFLLINVCYIQHLQSCSEVFSSIICESKMCSTPYFCYDIQLKKVIALLRNS
jgi:hypothetical protein